ncbi:hypothetical protein QOZ80_7BG0594950 [Eleusine coracana subsp. coracana]|nr:hypothetical protein QOZ80_7BG0594950 [Eleusine coracana subsp. coracana]
MACLQTLSSCATIVLLLVLVPHTCTASTLQDKCEKYAGGTQSEYDFCMKTMQIDAASATADARGLAVIAARIARAMANVTEDRIEAELRLRGAGAAPSARRDRLSACAAEYAATARRLELAARVAAGPAGGGARELRQAQAILFEAYGAAELCDAEFANARLPGSPVTAADRRLDGVISMAISFLPIASSKTRA